MTLITSEKKTILRLVGTDGHRLAVAEQEVGKPAPKALRKRSKPSFRKKRRMRCSAFSKKAARANP